MLKCIVLKGLPASGKSSWAKQQLKENPGAYKIVNKDLLRLMLDDSKHSKANESFVLQIRNSIILLALQHGKHVIVDDTNLHPKHIQDISELVKGAAILEVKDFTDVSMEECIARDKKRQNYVGEAVIRKMYHDFLEKSVDAPEYDRNLPDAIIVDLDGTLALYGNKNPYDRDFSLDRLNPVVGELVQNEMKLGTTLLFTSARNDKFRDVTYTWLKERDFCSGDHLLFMRKDGDFRKDFIVKEEMYNQHIAGKYNIKYCLDDRNQVIKLWRSLGLVALQVADGDF